MNYCMKGNYARPLTIQVPVQIYPNLNNNVRHVSLQISPTIDGYE